MAVFRAAVRSLCGPYFHFGKTWNRWSKFKSGNRHPDRCSRSDGLGNGISYPCSKRNFSLGRKSWIFLILSGLATGASWLCYYRALQLGDASKVVPVDKLSVVMTLILAFVFLHEDFTAKSLIGCILIGAGTLVMVL